MSMAELTHAYQHLAAQAALDQGWMKKVQEALTDHAGRLDSHADCLKKIIPGLEQKCDNKTVDKSLYATCWVGLHNSMAAQMCAAQASL